MNTGESPGHGRSQNPRAWSAPSVTGSSGESVQSDAMWPEGTEYIPQRTPLFKGWAGAEKPASVTAPGG